MALRHNHYEAAFEAYLRFRRIPYIAVDEAKRSFVEEASLKSVDFLVSVLGGDNFLVDVKGRRYPTTEKGNRWENWVTAEDVDSLLAWEEVFGSSHRGLFVFAYDVAETHLEDFEALFQFRDREYAFFGVVACDYRAVMTQRSPRWNTVSVARRPFAALRFPIDELITSRRPPPAASDPDRSPANADEVPF